MRQLSLTNNQRVYLPEQPLIDPDFRTKPMISKEEFFDELYHEVGKQFGLADIREAK